jgi:16S rRNA (cytidine1402-2'-O)-methyltransferase
MVFFESPHRIKEALEDAAEIFGADRLATVSRELTKKFEHTERAPLADLIEWAKTDPKGEMVLVVAGAVEEVRPLEDIVEEVLADQENGLKQAVAICAAKYGVSKSALYQAALEARALR